MRKQTLSSEHKQQIYHLHSQGLTPKEIADAMHIDNPQQVAGVVRAGQNFGKIARRPGATSAPPPPVAAQMSGAGSATLEAPPMRAPEFEPEVPQSSIVVPQPPSAPPPAMVVPVPLVPPPDLAAASSRHVMLPRERPMPEFQADGFQGWSGATGFTGGFSNQSAVIRYQVYRDEPSDGLLGEHNAPFGEAELGRLYGSGLYRILRFDPANPRVPYQTSVRIAPSYGEPRFPRSERGGGAARPNYSRWGARPFGRSQEGQGQEEEVRPLERPTLYDYSRHTPSTDAAVEAIRQMGQSAVKQMELTEQARKQGPDSFVTRFFTEQQALWQRQLDEQRRMDDQRRRDEEEKWTRHQKEAEAEHRRRQDEEEKRHDRELARIKAEADSRSREADAMRKALLDVEGHKLKVIEEQNKLRQDALQDELKRNRDQQKEQQDRLEIQLKDMHQNTQAAIQENQERMEKEMQRDREQLDREHKLKEKGLDKEYELNQKVLDMKQTALEAQGTNEIFQVVNNVINKFSAGVKDIVELKKLEVATPDAQVALATKSVGEHKAQEASDARAAQAGAQAGGPSEAGSSTNPKAGNGQATAPSGEVQREASMKQMIRDMMDQPFFKEVLDEWSVHVKGGMDGTLFLNMYREWMCDPDDPQGRKATTMFANYIGPRSWEEFYEVIKDKLDPKIQKTFELPNAKTFYETFRTLITEQIRAFWEDFGQSRDAINAGRIAAGADKGAVAK